MNCEQLKSMRVNERVKERNKKREREIRKTQMREYNVIM